jgi:hypothetical protein
VLQVVVDPTDELVADPHARNGSRLLRTRAEPAEELLVTAGDEELRVPGPRRLQPHDAVGCDCRILQDPLRVCACAARVG